jgi:hypothetical protein
MRQLWLLLLTTTAQNNDIISVTFFYLFIDINILLKSSRPTVYRWWNMVLANRWLRVEHCCTVMSYDALGHFLIFIWLLGPLAFFNRTNIIQMIFSMSWELYILCIILKTTAFFNRTNIIQMIFSMSWELYILCIILKITAFFRCCLFFRFFYLILEVFRMCGIFGSVPNVWYFWKCSDCVVFLEVFRLCGISCFHLNTTIILEIYIYIV